MTVTPTPPLIRIIALPARFMILIGMNDGTACQIISPWNYRQTTGDRNIFRCSSNGTPMGFGVVFEQNSCITQKHMIIRLQHESE